MRQVGSHVDPLAASNGIASGCGLCPYAIVVPHRGLSLMRRVCVCWIWHVHVSTNAAMPLIILDCTGSPPIRLQIKSALPGLEPFHCQVVAVKVMLCPGRWVLDAAWLCQCICASPGCQPGTQHLLPCTLVEVLWCCFPQMSCVWNGSWLTHLTERWACQPSHTFHGVSSLPMIMWVSVQGIEGVSAPPPSGFACCT